MRDKETMSKTDDKMTLFTLPTPDDQAWKFRHYFVTTMKIPEEQIVSPSLLPPETFGIKLTKEQHALIVTSK